MTFLLQKFNAINRTCTEARARNGLRLTAGGIAFTGRLAACLLLAGFLGVGSAMAQPHVLRMGDGAVTVSTDLSNGDDGKVHHYVIGKTATNDPTSNGSVNTFLVGSIALVTFDDIANTLMVTPVAVGAFKIALTSAIGALTDDLSTIGGTPINFEILSGNAPMLIGAADNAAVQIDMVSLELIPRDDTSKEYDLLDWFSDPNDVFLTYEAKVDMVAKDDPDPLPDPLVAPRRAKVDKDGVNIVSATRVGNKLTVALTKDAKMADQTDIWVFGRDGSEYARKRIQVTVGSSTNPYVMTVIADDVLREDAAADTHYELASGFMDPDVASTDRDVDDGDAMTLTYAVSISDKNAAKVGSEVYFTWVTSYMTARVVLRDTDADAVGHEGGALLTIRPRAPGSATFTVTATDKGEFCRDAGADESVNVVDKEGSNTEHDATGDVAAVRCQHIDTSGAENDTTYTALFPDTKSVKDAFTVTIVTKTSPISDVEIDAMEVVADGDAIMFDLEDLNGDKDGEPKAFTDPTKEGLTYTVEAAQVKDNDIATVSVDGSMVTIAPLWRSGDENTTVTVKATNNLDEESLSSTFGLTVKTATKPVVNQSLAVQGVLAMGFSLNTGDAPMVVPLANLTGATEPPFVALFIDPNAAARDALPGGLLLEMKVEDVVADHVYENQSKTNDVTTSAMRLVLDPSGPNPTLTITPTGANSATVTVRATDRERNMVSAMTTITVISGVGTEGEELPTEVSLSQNYPNPFNPQTTIDYALPKAGDVSLVVYDMLGREVDVLLDGPQAAGRHTVRFGANHLPNGTYVYRLVAADKTITRTMVLVK